MCTQVFDPADGLVQSVIGFRSPMASEAESMFKAEAPAQKLGAQ